VPTTSGRIRGRQGAHSGPQGAAGDHLPKIMAVMGAATVIIVFVLVMTRAGREIDAATQHFMLFYAGVFALVGLTGSVLAGLVATDRTVMTPGHRVMAQAVHRAVSFGALAFLVIHIVTEILAQRVHVIDAFIPFLSPFRTFYIGLGTIASDLILLIAITGILRKRFTGHGKAWRWRAIHYSSYAAFAFGVLHGLLGGREAKPYVDWSYGFAIAVTALGLAVRFLAVSLRPKESLSVAPGADRSRAPASSPLHAAAMGMAQAQLGRTVLVLPAGMGARGAGPGRQAVNPWATLPGAPGWPSSAGPIPALAPAPAYATEPSSGAYPSYPSAETYRSPGAYPSPEAYRSAEAYRELGFTPLGAPPYGDDVPVGPTGLPYVAADPQRPPLPGPAGAPGPRATARRPLYEPGYDGPPRFEGAPRGHVPQDELSSYPYGPPSNQQQLGARYPGDYANQDGSNGPARSRPSRAIESLSSRSAQSVQAHQEDRNTGSIPRVGSGPMPRLDSGPIPRVGNHQLPRNSTGPLPRTGPGPVPRPDTGPIPRVGTGPIPRVGTGQAPRTGTGPVRRTGEGPVPWVDSGLMPRAGTDPMPRPEMSPSPWVGSGQLPRAAGRIGRPGTDPTPPLEAGPARHADTGPIPRVSPGPTSRLGTGPAPWSDTGPVPWAGAGPLPRTGPPAPSANPGPESRTRPGMAANPSRRDSSADQRYREVPEPTGGDEW
jgi:hypothetical protein